MINRRISLIGAGIGLSVLFIVIALYMYSGNKETQPKIISVIFLNNTSSRNLSSSNLDSVRKSLFS